MIETVQGQPVRPKQPYSNINIQINMTVPKPKKPQELEENHVCPNCGYYFNVPTVSIYNPELKENSKEKQSDKVLIVPQQTSVKTTSATKKEKVTNPISEIPPTIVKTKEEQLQKNNIQNNDKEEQNIIQKGDIKSQKPSEPEIIKNEKNEKPITPKKIEVVEPQDLKPVIDINTFIAELTNPDFTRQADAISVIGQVAQASPEIGTQFLDIRIIDTLLGIVNADTSSLAAPTQRQLQIRQAILMEQPVTKAERIEASVKAPVELAEENKEGALYTLAILQKIYGDEVEKMGGKINSLKDIPAATEIIKETINNQNPHIKVAGISALHYIRKPEFHEELQAIYKSASTDENPVVRAVAQKAIELN